jgi:CRP/FNR family cyclic AMP-dependent transcriptional regulator
MYRDGMVDVTGLSKVSLFAGLDDAALERVAEMATEVEVGADHTLIELGHPGSGLFILEEGHAVVERPDGKRIEREAGSFFGELALLTDGNRTARVRTTTSCKLLAVSRSDFQGLLMSEPKIALAMLRTLADRLAES